MAKIKGISVVILGGGEGKRLGGCDKARLMVGGISLIEKTIAILSGIFSEALIIAGEKYHYDYQDVKVYNDEIKGKGPLSGIYTGLCRIKNQAAFFTACDMPFLHNELIIRQVTLFKRLRCDCLLTRINKNIEPLHAIYRKSIKDDLREYLLKGNDNSVRNFIKTLDARYLDLEDTAQNRMIFSNINTKEDLENAESKIKRKIKSLAGKRQ